MLQITTGFLVMVASVTALHFLGKLVIWSTCGGSHPYDPPAVCIGFITLAAITFVLFLSYAIGAEIIGE